MDIQEQLKQDIQQAIQAVYNTSVEEVALQPTKKEFEGLYTFVTFPLTKSLRKSPAEIGQAIGNWLQNNSTVVSRFNVVQGFLNLSIADSVWISVLNTIHTDNMFGTHPAKPESVMVEFSSPNTNKPLHLGHLRNNFLGDSISRLLAANGYDVVKTCLVNDRGIHICKSMLAYQKFGNDETPESAGLKGDHFIGKYYVLFDKELRIQLKPILEAIYSGGDLTLFSETEQTKIKEYLGVLNQLEIRLSNEVHALDSSAIAEFGFRVEVDAESARDGNLHWKSLINSIEENDSKVKEQKQKELQKILRPVLQIEEKIEEIKAEVKDAAQSKTALMQEAQEMLRKWEQGDPETVALWEKMNAWVYAGFAETYKKIGVSFDKTYYESNTYLLGKDVVEEGLANGIFYRKDDGSVWIDLTDEGLDQKLVLRSDGTSVYMTQDLGTTDLKFTDYHNNRMVWVVGNEQDYHFKVLFAIMRRLGRTFADGCYHLSYGMVDLPSGKMKSREGTVVDADDLIDEVTRAAANAAEQAAKSRYDDFSEQDRQALFRMIGLGALKYFLLKVDPQKRMLFNPEESVDVHGHTGPFIQYTHARTQSVLEKAAVAGLTLSDTLPSVELHETERQLIFLLSQYPQRVVEAGQQYSPAYLAQFAYDLAKTYNQFYADVSILAEPNPDKTQVRLTISKAVGQTIRLAMGLLGIEVPDKM